MLNATVAIRNKPWSIYIKDHIELLPRYICTDSAVIIERILTKPQAQIRQEVTSHHWACRSPASITVDHSQVIRAGNTPHMTVVKVTVTIKLITMQQIAAAWLQLTIQTLHLHT